MPNPSHIYHMAISHARPITYITYGYITCQTLYTYNIWLYHMPGLYTPYYITSCLNTPPSVRTLILPIYTKVSGLSSCLYIPPSARTLILLIYTPKCQDSHLAYIYPQVPGLSSYLYIPPSAKTLILPIYTSSARTLICIIQRFIIDDVVNIPKSQDLY